MAHCLLQNENPTLDTQARACLAAFMQSVYAIGQETLGTIAQHDPSLHQALLGRFKHNQGRAAFWLMTDRTHLKGLTPLQQLRQEGTAPFRQRLADHSPRTHER